MTSHCNAVEAGEDLTRSTRQDHPDQAVSTVMQPPHESQMVSSRPASTMRRVGKLPCVLLLLSVFGTVAFIVYITFLWFAASENEVWKKIVVSGWTTRSIAIAAVALRTATTTQAGIASSMLAAVMLERTRGVSLADLASLSLMRSSSAAPYTLFTRSNFAHNKQDLLHVTLGAVLSITTMFLQFTSTTLLANVNSGFIVGSAQPYSWVWSGTYEGPRFGWLIAPRPWPVFAEYSENNSANGSLGYSDTGVTIIALFPVRAESRPLIHTYKGSSPLLDVRTVCVRPSITDTRVTLGDHARSAVRGKISMPTDLQPIVSTATPLQSLKPTDFVCALSAGFDDDSDHYKGRANLTYTSSWDLTICDLRNSTSAELISNFGETRIRQRSVFLLINYTGYIHQDHDRATSYPPLDLANFNDTTPGLSYHSKNEWLHLQQDAGTLNRSDADLDFSKTKLSFTICVPVWDRYDLNLSTSSSRPLKEPIYSYDPERNLFDYGDIWRQLFQSSGESLNRRGVSSLELQLVNRTHSVIATAANSETIAIPFAYGWTIDGVIHSPTIHLLDDASGFSSKSDKAIAGIGLESLREGETPARALQSMLMSVCLAEYQNLLFTQVDAGATDNHASLSLFVPAQIPGEKGRSATHPAGATWSYVMVMFATAVHSLVVGAIIVMFIRDTKSTLLWQNWHTIAQTSGAVTEPYLTHSSLATDSEIKNQMAKGGVSTLSVSLRSDATGLKAEVGTVRQRVKNTVSRDESQKSLLSEELRESSRDVV